MAGRSGSSVASTEPGPRAVEPDAEHRQELLAADRLGEVVRRARLEALAAVVLHGLGRQGDDRQVTEPVDAPGSPAIVS